jgi:hypothetical protein
VPELPVLGPVGVFGIFGGLFAPPEITTVNSVENEL